MHKTMTIFLAGTVLMIPVCAGAQDTPNATDSVPETKEVKNRNVMLNASSDNQPRQISIGLPENKSATIYEDGLPVSYSMWPCLPYQYWKATTQHRTIFLVSPIEILVTVAPLLHTATGIVHFFQQCYFCLFLTVSLMTGSNGGVKSLQVFPYIYLAVSTRTGQQREIHHADNDKSLHK